MQVDEQSVFRHRGERKVKTVEEDMEEVASVTSELLNEEGEELMGKLARRDSCESDATVPTPRPAAGGESSNEEPAEEGKDGEDKGDDGGELPANGQEEEGSEEEETELAFPDTSISLSHLQPSR